jgi:selenophosphate synthetase-related protein
MGTYLISVPESQVDAIIEIAAGNKCPITEVGIVTEKTEMKIGKKVVVSERKMQQLIRSYPYKKPRKKC